MNRYEVHNHKYVLGFIYIVFAMLWYGEASDEPSPAHALSDCLGLCALSFAAPKHIWLVYGILKKLKIILHAA
jgi:hypothetical protein